MISVEHPANPDGGLPLNLITGGRLQLVSDPWDLKYAGDSARILLGDSDIPVLSQTVQPGEENERLTLYLPGDLLSNGINKIRLSVLRIGQTVPQTSQPLTVLFHRPRPGGEVSGPGDNPNLTLTLPADVIANGVDAAMAAQGVLLKMSYPYMREKDVIVLDRDSQETQHTVTLSRPAPVAWTSS